MVTGMRGLCNGLGPAMFGVIFYVFHVDLNDESNNLNNHSSDSKFTKNETVHMVDTYAQLMPGPPFVFGAFMVVCALVVAAFIPEETSDAIRRPSGEKKKKSSVTFLFYYLLLFLLL